jgi:hypothetical protein
MIMPRIAYRQPQAGSQGFARTKKVFGSPSITFVAGDVVLNAQTAVARVPKGFVLQSISGNVGDMDSGATLTIALGDAGNNARFFAANPVGQAGGAMPALLPAAVGYEFPDDTDILVTATAAAAGLGPTPTFALLMEGYIR